MGYIHCCSGLHKTRSFVLVPAKNFTVCEMDYLAKCPVCGHTVLQLTRIDCDNNLSTIRYINKNAQRFFKKKQKDILYERKEIDYTNQKGTFYLNYNEYGVIKRCYSNLSNMKLGLKNIFT